LRISRTNPRNKVGLEKAPVTADLGARDDPAADLCTDGVGMEFEEGCGAAKRQDGVMPAFTAEGHVGHGPGGPSSGRAKILDIAFSAQVAASRRNRGIVEL